MRANTSSKPSRRLFELDLLRFAAAVAVMLYHYTYRAALPGGYLSLKFPVLGEVFQYGYLGVDLFFIISGFVILMTAQKRDWAGFVISRIVRLYPAYWFSVTLTALVVLAAHNDRFSVGLVQYFVNLTMLQEALGFRHIDGVYWSLFVELIFYFWVFLVSFGRQISRADKILGVWLAASIAFNIFGGLTFTSLDLMLIPRWSFYFIAGGAFYLIQQRGPSLYLSSLAFVSYVMVIKLTLENFEGGNPFVVCALITLFFLIFTAIAFHYSLPVEKPWMITVGLLTYPLYLIHQDIGYLLLSAFQGSLPRLLSLLVVVTIVLLGAYLIATQVERRFALVLKRTITRLIDVAREGGVGLKVRQAEQR